MQKVEAKIWHYFRLIKDILLFFALAAYYFCESLLMFVIPRSFRAKSVVDEVVLVTGAGGGIGRLMALKFAKLGAIVVVWELQKHALRDTVELITKHGGKVHGFTCDLANREEIYKTANLVKRTIGNVSILINNAGIVFGKTLMDLQDNEIDMTFRVNVLSHYWTTKAFLKSMMEKNNGHVVTVASVAGLLGTYKCTDYSATKFATVGFHESLFTELRTHGYDGIHLTLICPYYINTGMFFGVKPRLMPMLEPDVVAEQSVAAILANEINVTLPTCIRYFLPLKWTFVTVNTINPINFIKFLLKLGQCDKLKYLSNFTLSYLAWLSFLPDKLCWALMYYVMQGPQSMMTFKGRNKCKSMLN